MSELASFTSERDLPALPELLMTLSEGAYCNLSPPPETDAHLAQSVPAYPEQPQVLAPLESQPDISGHPFAQQIQALEANPYCVNVLSKWLSLDLEMSSSHSMPLLMLPASGIKEAIPQMSYGAGSASSSREKPGIQHPTTNMACTDSFSGGRATSSGHTATKSKASPQKRFRERQKAMMQSLEHTVRDKQEQYRRLLGENDQLKAHASVLEQVVACRDEQLSVLSYFDNACAAPGSASSCFGALSSHLLDPVAIHASEMAPMVQALTAQQVAGQWKTFLADATGLLLRCNSGTTDPTTSDTLVTMVHEVGKLIKHIMLLNAPLMRTLVTSNLEKGVAEAAPSGHWASVLGAISLSEAQRRDILAVFSMYRGLIVKVYEERSLIMSAFAPSLASGIGTRDAMAVSRMSVPHEIELIDMLNKNLTKENSAQLMLMCFLLGKVLSAEQFCRVSVYSYPYFPDALALASSLAAHTGHVVMLPKDATAAAAAAAAAASMGSAPY